MPDNGEQPGHDSHSLIPRRLGHGSLQQQRRQKLRGQISLERIDHKHSDARSLSQKPEHIGRADIPAAYVADIHAFGARPEIPGRNRSDEISNYRSEEIARHLAETLVKRRPGASAAGHSLALNQNSVFLRVTSLVGAAD